MGSIERVLEVRGIALTSLSSLLEVTVDTHAGETENSGVNHLDGWSKDSKRSNCEVLVDVS